MNSDLDTSIKNVLAFVFDIDVEEINDDSSPRSIESWDSLKHINMIVALEKEFDIQLNDYEIEAMVNYKIIFATVQSHLG